MFQSILFYFVFFPYFFFFFFLLWLLFALFLYLGYWASQVVLAVKNPPANSGDVRDIGSTPGGEDPLEESMETHFSILTC